MMCVSIAIAAACGVLFFSLPFALMPDGFAGIGAWLENAAARRSVSGHSIGRR